MKKVVLILIPLLLVGGGGGAFFAATKGIINIPGVTPAKKKNAAASLYGEQKDPKLVEAEKKKKLDEEAAKLKKEEADKLLALEAKKPKPEVGYETVAALWSNMKPDALIATTADWKPADLAPILVTMDPELVSKFLSKLSEKEAKRASDITRAIQTKASEPKV